MLPRCLWVHCSIFRPMCSPLPTSKEEVLQGFSCFITSSLIRLRDVDSIEVSIEPSQASPEVGQRARFFPR